MKFYFPVDLIIIRLSRQFARKEEIMPENIQTIWYLNKIEKEKTAMCLSIDEDEEYFSINIIANLIVEISEDMEILWYQMII